MARQSHCLSPLLSQHKLNPRQYTLRLTTPCGGAYRDELFSYEDMLLLRVLPIYVLTRL